MGRLGEEELTLSRQQAFPFFLAGGLDLTGAALVARGDVEAGLARMREGARVYRAAGVEVGLVHLSHLAQVLLDTDHVDEALAVVADALGRARAGGERVYRAELYRIKGGALLRRGEREAAAACFRDAIDLAREQGARVFELRAVTSLAGLAPAPSAPRFASNWPRAAPGSPRGSTWPISARPGPCSAGRQLRSLRHEVFSDLAGDGGGREASRTSPSSRHSFAGSGPLAVVCLSSSFWRWPSTSRRTRSSSGTARAPKIGSQCCRPL